MLWHMTSTNASTLDTRPFRRLPKRLLRRRQVRQMPRVQVCTVVDLEDNTMRRFVLNGHEILLAKISDQYYAVNERCTHRGGPLSEGRLAGFSVTCPLHF